MYHVKAVNKNLELSTHTQERGDHYGRERQEGRGRTGQNEHGEMRLSGMGVTEEEEEEEEEEGSRRGSRNPTANSIAVCKQLIGEGGKNISKIQGRHNAQATTNNQKQTLRDERRGTQVGTTRSELRNGMQKNTKKTRELGKQTERRGTGHTSMK